MIPTPEHVERNYQAFRKMLPQIIRQNENKYALLRDEQIVGFFETAGDASQAGKIAFADAKYSIQKVTDKPERLGYRIRAVH